MKIAIIDIKHMVVDTEVTKGTSNAIGPNVMALLENKANREVRLTQENGETIFRVLEDN